jgi:hypothetical protein
MLRISSLAVAGTVAAALLVGGTDAIAAPNALCVYTVTVTPTYVYKSASTSSTKLYSVAKSSKVSAVNTAISGPGGPFYKGEASGKAQGYIQVSHLSGGTSCAG